MAKLTPGCVCCSRANRCWRDIPERTGVECICLDEDWVEDPHHAQLLIHPPCASTRLTPPISPILPAQRGSRKAWSLRLRQPGRLPRRSITGYFQAAPRRPDFVLCRTRVSTPRSRKSCQPGCSGATVVMRAESIPSLAQFNQLIEEQHLTVLSLPAAYWAEWTLDLETRHARFAGTFAHRHGLCGGTQYQPLRQLAETAKCWPRSAGLMPMGRPRPPSPRPSLNPVRKDQPGNMVSFPGWQTLAQPFGLHPRQLPVNRWPMGVPGEIYIGGDTALGYLHMPRES